MHLRARRLSEPRAFRLWRSIGDHLEAGDPRGLDNIRGKVAYTRYRLLRALCELQQVEGQMEVSHTPRITAHHLAVAQAGPDLEVVHSLDDERIARRPVVTSTGDQPDALGVATGHEPEPSCLIS
jgi:hypothetical protein